MRLFKIIILGCVTMGLITFLSSLFSSVKKRDVAGTLYDFTINGLDGQPISFDRYRGKNVLIVNTASRCGYTPQYADLEKLHEQYGEQVTVLGFPANNFMWQEPGTNQEIAEFCEVNYGVKFQLFEKISVKGNDQHPLYQWLEAKSGHRPSWNFCKYLIDKNGDVVSYYSSKVNPLDKEIIRKITM